VDRYQYLLLLAMCLLLTLPLEFVFRARVWARFGQYLQALALPFILFNAVNEWAVLRRLWRYSPDYTTGWRVPRQYPVEELVFFLVIPLCAVLTFETARNVYEGRVPPLRDWLRSPTAAKQMLQQAPQEIPQTPTHYGRRFAKAAGIVGLVGALATASAFLLLKLSNGRLHSAAKRIGKSFYKSTFENLDWNVPDYTVIVLLLLGIVLIVERIAKSHIFLMRAYWVSIGISGGFMVLMNGWLTKLSAPIVVYAGDEFVLARPVWDIPTEDFAFGFALLTMVLTCWIKVTGVRVTERKCLEDRVATVNEVDLAGVPAS
jgi:lycopene beta-cyclase